MRQGQQHLLWLSEVSYLAQTVAHRAYKERLRAGAEYLNESELVLELCCRGWLLVIVHVEVEEQRDERKRTQLVWLD